MAYDPRFAIAFVASSGEGGAKLHRRALRRARGERRRQRRVPLDGGQLHQVRRAADSANDLPVDSHELIALCAPRPVFISAGSFEVEGGWVDAKGMFLGAAGAGPVYRLLGKKDLGTTEFPPIETALVDGDIAFRQHRGGHTAGPNWPTFLTFAERYIKAPPSDGARGRHPTRPAGGRQKVALTFDDLPVHGALAAGHEPQPTLPGASWRRSRRTRLRRPTASSTPRDWRKRPATRRSCDSGARPGIRWRTTRSRTWTSMRTRRKPSSRTSSPTKRRCGRYMGDEGWRWLRFPYLHEGDTLEKRREVARFLKERGYRVAQVTIELRRLGLQRPLRPVPGEERRRGGRVDEGQLPPSRGHVHPGGQERARLVFGRDIAHVMLLHLGAFRRRHAAELLDLLEKRGFELVTLQEAQSDPAYAIDPDLAIPVRSDMARPRWQPRRASRSRTTVRRHAGAARRRCAADSQVGGL